MHNHNDDASPGQDRNFHGEREETRRVTVTAASPQIGWTGWWERPQASNRVVQFFAFGRGRWMAQQQPLVSATATTTGCLSGCTPDGRMGACCGFTPSSPGCSAWALLGKVTCTVISNPLRGVTPKAAGGGGLSVSLQAYKTLGWLGTLARPRGQVSELSAQRRVTPRHWMSRALCTTQA